MKTETSAREVATMCSRLRAMREDFALGSELRHAFNEAADRMEVLVSKLHQEGGGPTVATPAEGVELPPLPKGKYDWWDDYYTGLHLSDQPADRYQQLGLYDEDQMREYARVAVHSERGRLLRLLAHAVREANGWHDESRGGNIEGDPLIDEAMALIRSCGPNPTQK